MTHDSSPGGGSRPRQTSAARLLAAIEAGGQMSRLELARTLGASADDLEATILGHRPLPLELQMRLAALAPLVAPEHRRAAARLYDQAQAAMRMEASDAQRHVTYPRHTFR